MAVLMAKLLMTDLLVIVCLSVPIGALAAGKSIHLSWLLFALAPVVCAPVLAIALGVCQIWGIK